MANDEKTNPAAPETPGVSRREFIKTAAITGAGFTIVPRRVLGQGLTPPSDLVNIATVGIGGMGGNNTMAVMSQNIVAICDVDFDLLDGKLKSWRDRVYPAKPPAPPRPPTPRAASPWKDFGPTDAQKAADAKWVQAPEIDRLKRFVDEQMPKVAKYRDYREMLEKQKDIDAIIVATPDHMHAVIASNAMDAGKHVYVQKPLCWSVHEARHLAKKAADMPKLVTQMGNQGHSQDDARTGQEYLMAGAIGDVHEIRVWTNRPLGYWPQGVPRPAPLPPPAISPTTGEPLPLKWDNPGVNARLAAAMLGSYPVPATLSWDLFLGVAPDVPYHPIYHPFNWRGWVDWGQGALGDMGAHLIDHPVWGLNLGLPTTIETVSTPFNGVSYPVGTSTYYEFPSPKGKGTIKLTWSDGGLLPSRPDELGDEKLLADGGVIYYGSKGKLLQQTYGARPRLLPADRHNSYGLPKTRLPRIPHESHEMNWVNAIRGRDTISCPFSYAAHLVEIMLLGVVSLRAGTKIHYDGANMRVTTTPAPKAPDANEFLTRTYRQGYSL
ncbi:MAG TPA: Gfo/Idh/MocA family oxidoreductase [Vicinamibacterales bacterium]|nr:Gfo/Idh/MocA family oxidoreductase [Vicinamibacterales bacterium]